MTELDRTIPVAVPLLQRWLRPLKALYRRSLREDSRRRIRNTIKRVSGKRAASRALAYMPPAVAKALSTNPAIAEKTLLTEAKELAAAWRLGEALAKVDAALSIGRSQGAYRLRATILASMGDRAGSAEASRNLLALNPLDIAGYRQLKALGEQHPPVSLEIALEAVRSMGGTSTAYLRAAEYLYFFGRFRDVLNVCEMGISVNEDENPSDRQARSLYNLLLHKGYALEGLHRHDNAVRLYEEMADRAFEVRHVIPIARCLLELGHPDKGIGLLRRAHVGEVDPQPFHPLTMDLLQANGDIREAYALYRKRPISLALAKMFKAEKHPLDLNILSEEYRSKEALILSEGGPADELRMCSVYEELASCFGHLTITCEPRLKSIMERNFPDISFLPTARHRREIVKDMSDRSMLTDARLFQMVSNNVIVAAKDADLVCSLLDTLADLRPGREAFGRIKRARLKPHPELRKYWAATTKASGRVNIGLSWRSMLQSVARDRHYLTVTDLAPLGDVDADFWLLQPNATRDELEHLRSFLTLHVPEDLDLVNDFEGQLALTASLDFVISPFTTTGELGGAAGTPTMLVSTTKSTTWRRNPDGSDVWHAKTQIVTGDPIHDRISAMQVVAGKLQARIKPRKRKT